MRMSRLEKLFVNRGAKGRANAIRVQQQLAWLRSVGIRRVLEVGCGTGEVAASLARQLGCSVTGVDIDAAQITLARSRHATMANLCFNAGDAARLAFDSDSFDLVVAQNVFHHMPAWRQAIAEIARVMQPGGHLLWTDLTPPPRLAALLKPLRNRMGVYGLQELRDALSAAGLMELSVRSTIPWLPVRHDMILQKSGF